MHKLPNVSTYFSRARHWGSLFIPSPYISASVMSLPTALLQPAVDFRTTSVVTKSQNDGKQYRVIKLPNGLRAVLISDLPTDKRSQIAESTVNPSTVRNELPLKALCCSEVVPESNVSRYDITDEIVAEPACHTDREKLSALESDPVHTGPLNNFQPSEFAISAEKIASSQVTSQDIELLSVQKTNEHVTSSCVSDFEALQLTDVEDAGCDSDAVIMSDVEDSNWTDTSSSDSNSSLKLSSSFNHEKVSKRHCVTNEKQQLPFDESRHEKLSAAALCVGVGSFSDPAELPGLAHFLEHMLFMGSAKYPKENDFDDYVSQHGGSSNAFTDCEQTVFHFDVRRRYFHSALDRFAQFFVSPLMKRDSIDREIEAIDSEFQLSLSSDKHRIEQLLGSLANNNHPMAKFMWGNKETLKRQPSVAKINTYSSLQKFYRQHYLAQHMTLAVQSQESLDHLESTVRELFSSIRSSSVSRPHFEHLSPPFKNPSFNKIYQVVPVKNINQIVLTWALPSQLRNYKIKPLQYLGWLIGHEGKGSLASYFRRRSWAVEVESGNSETGFEHNTACSCFSITITLSEDGLQQLYQVVTVVFQYIAMLQHAGPQINIYNEIKKVDEIDFHFQEEADPQDNVEQLCSDMQLYDAEDLLTGSQLMMEYNAEVIADCVDALSPRRVNIIVLSKSFSKPRDFCKLKEKWFQTRYHVEDIPEDWLQSWSAPEQNEELSLPIANPYIAENFELKTDGESLNSLPVIISQSSAARLWYKKDDRFRTPRGYVYIYMQSAMVNSSAKSMCLLELYANLLSQSLSEIVYEAEVAQIGYEIQVIDNGLTLKFGGFNDKLLQLFNSVVSHIAQFNVTDKQFDVIKRHQQSRYFNQTVKPHKLCRDLRKSLLIRYHWSVMEKLDELKDLDLQALMKFASTFYSALHVDILAHGNLTVEEAKYVESVVVKQLNIQPLLTGTSAEVAWHLRYDVGLDQRSKATSTAIVVTDLPADSSVSFHAKSQNITDNNCTIANYYQHGPATINEFVSMELLMLLMEEPCFDWLRTRKQLGYSVDCELSIVRGILGYIITVCSQSNKYSMEHLDEQIEMFRYQFQKHIDELEVGKFNKLVASLVATKCIPHTCMADEVDQNWTEILDGTFFFDRLKAEIELLKKLVLSDFKLWSKNHLTLSSQSMHCRKLSVQVTGNVKKNRQLNKVVCNGNQPNKLTVDKKGRKGNCNKVTTVSTVEAVSQPTKPVVNMDRVDVFRTKYPSYSPAKLI